MGSRPRRWNAGPQRRIVGSALRVTTIACPPGAASTRSCPSPPPSCASGAFVVRGAGDGPPAANHPLGGIVEGIVGQEGTGSNSGPDERSRSRDTDSPSPRTALRPPYILYGPRDEGCMAGEHAIGRIRQPGRKGSVARGFPASRRRAKARLACVPNAGSWRGRQSPPRGSCCGSRRPRSYRAASAFG